MAFSSCSTSHITSNTSDIQYSECRLFPKRSRTLIRGEAVCDRGCGFLNVTGEEAEWVIPNRFGSGVPGAHSALIPLSNPDMSSILKLPWRMGQDRGRRGGGRKKREAKQESGAQPAWECESLEAARKPVWDDPCSLLLERRAELPLLVPPLPL